MHINNTQFLKCTNNTARGYICWRRDSRRSDCVLCTQREYLTKYKLTFPFLVKDFVCTQVGKVKSLCFHFPESMCKTPRLWCRLGPLRPRTVALFAQEGIRNSREEDANKSSSGNGLNTRERQRTALHVIKCNLKR